MGPKEEENRNGIIKRRGDGRNEGRGIIGMRRRGHAREERTEKGR